MKVEEQWVKLVPVDGLYHVEYVSRKEIDSVGMKYIINNKKFLNIMHNHDVDTIYYSYFENEDL
jgi:hypothetical protein